MRKTHWKNAAVKRRKIASFLRKKSLPWNIRSFFGKIFYYGAWLSVDYRQAGVRAFSL